jgi:hypothetical protein
VVEADARELAVEHWQVGRSPFLRASAVCAGPKDVDNNDDQNHRYDHKLLVEVGETCALPNAIPRSVGTVRVQVSGSSLSGSSSTRRDRGCRVRRCQRRSCCRKIGEVYIDKCQCAALCGRSDEALTGVAGQSRRDGGGASKETFHEVRHIVDAWGGAETKVGDFS